MKRIEHIQNCGDAVFVAGRRSCRLRVVSNFGDGDYGAGKIHTRARLLELSRARVCILPAPQSQSPKLETTRSL